MSAFVIDKFPEGQRVMFDGQGDRGTVVGDVDPTEAALGRLIRVQWDDGLVAHHKPTELSPMRDAGDEALQTGLGTTGAEVRRLREGIQQAIDLWANGDDVPAHVLADHLQGLLSPVRA